MGGADASNLGDQPGTWLIEVLSSSEEDEEQSNDQANMQQTATAATHEPLQFQSAATCDVLVEDELDGLDGLDLVSMD